MGKSWVPNLSGKETYLYVYCLFRQTTRTSNFCEKVLDSVRLLWITSLISYGNHGEYHTHVAPLGLGCGWIWHLYTHAAPLGL